EGRLAQRTAGTLHQFSVPYLAIAIENGMNDHGLNNRCSGRHRNESREANGSAQKRSGTVRFHLLAWRQRGAGYGVGEALNTGIQDRVAAFRNGELPWQYASVELHRVRVVIDHVNSRHV